MKVVTGESAVLKHAQITNFTEGGEDVTVASIPIMPSTQIPSVLDRYETEKGRIFLSGIQALVRLPIEQLRRDKRAGLRTRAYITGYPGSPLGGYDIALGQATKTLNSHGAIHQPGQNEELAATTLMGTQMLDEHPHPDVDGVVAYWYGKGPGIDRSGDALKHGNFAGTSTHGAVVILSGEDHEANSSTVPYQQEFSFEHFGIPVLYPATVAEFLEFGLHAAEMSRYSGCWVALKLVGPLCDGGEVVTVFPDQFTCKKPELQLNGKPFKKVANFTFFPGINIETERQLYVERHAAVKEYARLNQLNKVMHSGAKDRIGIVCAGKTYTDTCQAFADMGLDAEALTAGGIRIAKIGLLCPLDSEFIRQFAQGLAKIIVIEEKRDFLERQVAHALSGTGIISIIGKNDGNGQPLFPLEGGLNSDAIAMLLGKVLAEDIALPNTASARFNQITRLLNHDHKLQPRRTLNYCSGCPHNVSTKLAPGQIAWGAPGCHIFAAVMDTPDKRIEAITQFGGEGLPWIGLAPFTTRKHIVQNIGDGSLMHSSYQNIRFAVTAGVNITFKILFNGVIANTGGQVSPGAPSIVTLLSHLALEGVAKIVLIAKDASRYNNIKLPKSVSLRAVDALEASLVELSEIAGVTILLYDGECANERRRRQKRGKAPLPVRFTVVNEDVCENCGDCGRVANCMSLQKVKTEFGEKTQIHQSSCNQDQACIKGECPSFVTVEVAPGTKIKKPPLQTLDESLIPQPSMPSVARPYHVYIPGLGGTGVLTANAIMAQAASFDGNEVKSYDQTGAAQKWGAVLSSLIISAPGHPSITNRVGYGKADLYLVLDMLAGVDQKNLRCCQPELTGAVINSNVLPSGDMIRDPHIKLPYGDMIEAIGTVSRGSKNVVLDARRIAEGLFGDYVMANMVTIGAAYQAGLLPISSESMEKAITLNGTQVEVNILAFRAGRLSQHNPDALEEMLARPFNTLSDRVADLNDRRLDDERIVRLMDSNDLSGISEEFKRSIQTRVADLVDYQSVSYARHYLRKIADVAKSERAVLGEGGRLEATEAVARYLYKLMAYKDEYEVARLLMQRTFSMRVGQMFTGPVRMVFNLQPPFLRWFGLHRKAELGPWIRPLLHGLSKLKFLRGTAIDPFGYLAVRREERELIRWYESVIDEALLKLNSSNFQTICALLSLPDEIRGYERIKTNNIREAKAKALHLKEQLNSGRFAPKGVSVVYLSPQ
ncbi:indolepyruvate ferredoxin oxidoreductase family protein [Eoetvoesiella caeni]|uniref:Indolepyruvate ferredoxin oxidoreductase n=1 Tax=Eoetvoesiella caeni TaxID=645616 RepID=A0A366H8C5_9BURK|nr:indolepyruvate ferredoxin oxidoreductase family protein [Eoetvoesiella caeni]MCI2809688.1 indolepyruvate ferredoxin oxidoreductase family protein [Eoetvoesiella caeni]NYT56395.1 indolepyruvate ferredoxin oxidoreductase family protein [Eoetvoesiella caeni]RBP38453.1 indolepyruvate ferredoxin oxidoreductase [Eoetvoesiella caeni]